MLDYLKTIFGENIKIENFDYPNNIPFYIKDNYTALLLSWDKIQCVLLSPKTSTWRLPTLKTQLLHFQKLCILPCALCLEHMTSLQRRNLLENHIPFVTLSQQVYLPFWGCSFTEKFKADMSAGDKMAPGTQLVFLYFYYSHATEPINLTRLAKELRLSKATCTRAINDLTSSGLLTQKNEGTSKWISPAYEKKMLLQKGYPRLKSPIERLLYVQHLPDGFLYPESGLLALSDISMVSAEEPDGSIAVSKKVGSTMPSEELLSYQDFQDFGGYIVEVWSYDPDLFARNGRVDDISLLLGLESSSNERVQMGLDEIRKKHGLPIQEEE